LLATASMWMYLEFWVIPVEELYLIDRFGTDYEDYCSKTSRWLGRLNPSRYANARKRF
jgi:protein-S-isoprenylcysteine O-methyltransferase Ste14